MTPTTPRAEADAAAPRRGRIQWPIVAWLTVVWVLLWGNLSVANVASGLAVSLVVETVFPLPPIVFGGRIRPIGLLKLIWWWAADLVVASVQVVGQALRVGEHPRNAVIEVDLYSRSDLYLTLTAELVTLIPGSVVIEARRSTGTLFLHVLGVRGDADIEHARRTALREERRVLEALASPAELAEYRRASAGGER